MTKSSILLGLPKDHELLALIGTVAIRHGQLDYVLRMTVKSIAGLSIAEAVDATERQGSRDLRERIRKLAKQKLGEGQALCRLDAGFFTRARRATDTRNTLLHGLWASELDGRDVVRHDSKEWGDIPSIADLQKLADELVKIAEELNDARLDPDGFLKKALAKAA